MAKDRTDQLFKLKNGRTLGYAEYGDPTGKAVIHFHGSSGSRLEHPADESILETIGVRLITIDRPGHGLSDFQRGRKLLDWPSDVTALADHLKIDKFAVSGWSFGGPYAMVCAYRIPERLTVAGLISSFAPYDRPNSTAGMARFNIMSLRLARRVPFVIAKQFMKIQGRALKKDPEGTAQKMLASLPITDQEIINDPLVKGMLIPSITEAYRNGSDGAAWEGAILVRPWGFQLQDIAAPVRIWHGEADVNDPLQCGEYLRDTIPDTRAVFYPGEGHFLIIKRRGEILKELISE